MTHTLNEISLVEEGSKYPTRWRVPRPGGWFLDFREKRDYNRLRPVV